jgi:cytochrome P450
VTTTAFDHLAIGTPKSLFEWGEYFRERPVEYSEAHGGFWTVSRHEDIVAVLKAPSVFVSSRGTTIPSMNNPVPSLPTQADEPKHRYYRALIAPFLTPGAVGRLTSDIQGIVTHAIDAFIEGGTADLVTELAQPIPAKVMSRAFGLSDEDSDSVSTTFAKIVAAGTLGDSVAQALAFEQFMDWVKHKLGSSRSSSGGDLVAAILSAKAKDGLSDEECEGILWTAASAATETTAHAIGHGVNLLDVFPSVRAQLVADSTLIPGAVEEILRLGSPTFMMKRTVASPTELGGAHLGAGDQVMIAFGWGNHDGMFFENVQEFDLQRLPNQHLSFGYGIHKCSGMHLARAEVRIALESVLARLPDYERTLEVSPSLHSGVHWAFDSFPVRFTPGPRIA